MSVKQVNGHAVKRRKLDHVSSDEDAESVSGVEVDSDADEEVNDQSDNETDDSTSDDGSLPDGESPNGRSKQRAKNSTNLDIGVKLKCKADGQASFLSMAQDLIDQTRPDYDTRRKKVENLAERIARAIKGAPTQNAMSLAEAQSFSQRTLRTTIPWNPRPASDVKYTFAFLPPSNISICGPVAQNYGTRSVNTTTVAVEMPAEMFQEKDYLNHRALHKRAFYLTCLTSVLRDDLKTDFETRFVYPDDNSMEPVLQLTPRGREKWPVINVSPGFPPSLGPLAKTTPTSHCIRKEDLATKTKTDSSEATPFYNSTVRNLASRDSYTNLVVNAARTADHFQDASVLGQTWLQQRGFSTEICNGGFGIEEWVAICALLLESGGHQGRPLFSPRYSAVQLFKAMLQVLGNRDMNQPFILRGEASITTTDIPVFYDAKTGVNLLYKMTPHSYERLKGFAVASLLQVNSKNSSPFEATFMTKLANPPIQYDEVYEMKLSEIHAMSSSQIAKLYEVLKRGLGDRVVLLDVHNASSEAWSITSSAPKLTTSQFTLGITIKAETASRLIDHGPTVEETREAEAFRQFWGEKAELRRFKDGRINESLVWSDESPVTQQIIQYLCARHFQIPKNAISTSPDLADKLLPSKLSAPDAFAAVSQKFQTLSNTLHHLDDLPLPIRSVSAASEALRAASLSLPLEPGSAYPIDTVVQFDSSGRWPDDLRAIQYTKIAFLTKLGDLVRASDRSLETRVGIENTSTSTLGTQNTSFLDITYPSPSPQIPPILFRVRIYHDREVHLVQTALSSTTTPLSPPHRDAYQIALQLQKQIPASIAHTNAIRTLNTIFPPFSTTIRLLKRFIASHHLSTHIPPQLPELIAAHIFLNPSPWSVPGSATTAFTRCLAFLATWDWSTTPLILDLSPSQDSLTHDSRHELEMRFAAWRKMDPNLHTATYFIGTNLDASGVIWSQGIAGSDPHPPRVIAGRLTALASAAVQLITSTAIVSSSQWDDIFTSSLADFDFVLHLKSARSHKARGKAQFKNLEIARAVDADSTGIDDVGEFVKDLERTFGNVAVFLHGEGGDSVIGGLWRPHLRGPEQKTWKIRLGWSSVPVSVPGSKGEEREEALCKVNFEGMLAEMAILGEGIVDRISIGGQ